MVLSLTETSLGLAPRSPTPRPFSPSPVPAESRRLHAENEALRAENERLREQVADLRSSLERAEAGGPQRGARRGFRPAGGGGGGGGPRGAAPPVWLREGDPGGLPAGGHRSGLLREAGPLAGLLPAGPPPPAGGPVRRAAGGRP